METTALTVALARSDARPRSGGPNWQQYLTVHDARTGDLLALLLEIMHPDGSVTYRDAASSRKLRGSLETIIRAAANTR